MQDRPADFSSLHYAFGKPIVKAELKANAEDFKVEERIDFALSGHGEHLWCWVEKRNQNTDWVAGQLAKWAGTSKRNVGYAGQKDRNAVTMQWFSIQLPGKDDPDINACDIEGVRILKCQRHDKKLKRGGLQGNQFVIKLRNVSYIADDEVQLGDKGSVVLEVEQRLQNVLHHGVPNYFGEQRFGRNGNNLIAAEKMFAENSSNSNKRRRGRKSSDRSVQGLYLSAVRSWMFNRLLSLRIEEGCWNKILPGDIAHLDGSSKWFETEQTDEALQQRIEQGDIHPSGPLFGDGPLQTSLQSLELEKHIAEEYNVWIQGLIDRRVKPDRRALRVKPQNLQWTWLPDETTIELSFFLPAGCFATMLLREVMDTYEQSRY